jgi:hypothetical protein
MREKTNKLRNQEIIRSISQDICTCKDFINDLCNHADDLPDLKIGFELGIIQSILLRIMGDVSNVDF